MCIKPIFLKKQEGYVPCGKCPQCKLKRVNSWVHRLQQEERRHLNALFVTLTYDNNHVPIASSGYMTLVKKDVQDFMKRYRKHMWLAGDIAQVKYYAVGEYGSTTWRPHYHIILFDAYERLIRKSWTMGDVHIGTVTGSSIAYTCKYICKPKRVPAHRKDDRIPEFSLMSKGIGSNYIKPDTVCYHKNGMVDYVYNEFGRHMALPRYYRNKIFTHDERLILNAISQHKWNEHERLQIQSIGGHREYYEHKKQLFKNAMRNQKENISLRNKV